MGFQRLSEGRHQRWEDCFWFRCPLQLRLPLHRSEVDRLWKWLVVPRRLIWSHEWMWSSDWCFVEYLSTFDTNLIKAHVCISCDHLIDSVLLESVSCDCSYGINLGNSELLAIYWNVILISSWVMLWLMTHIISFFGSACLLDGHGSWGIERWIFVGARELWRKNFNENICCCKIYIF